MGLQENFPYFAAFRVEKAKGKSVLDGYRPPAVKAGKASINRENELRLFPKGAAENHSEKSENYIDKIFHKAPPFEHPAGISVSMRIMQTNFFIFSFLSFNG